MASKRHSTHTAARCKAPSPKQIDWRCQHCDQQTTDGWLAIHRRQVQQILDATRSNGWWRVWCRTCPAEVIGSNRRFRTSHHCIPLHRVATTDALHATTLRLAEGPHGEWLGRTGWAHITSVGGTEKATAAA